MAVTLEKELYNIKDDVATPEIRQRTFDEARELLDNVNESNLDFVVLIITKEDNIEVVGKASNQNILYFVESLFAQMDNNS